MERTGPFWDVLAGRGELPPIVRTLGFELIAVDPDAGTIETAFLAGEAFLNPAGAVQGGIVAAMLDDTMGPALVATLAPGEWAPTVHLSVQFLQAARPGRLLGFGQVVRRGTSIAFLEGRLTDADGRLLATATATARIGRNPGARGDSGR